jgi:hypothetical protein
MWCGEGKGTSCVGFISLNNYWLCDLVIHKIRKIQLACQCNYSYSMNGLNHVLLLCIRFSFGTNAIGWDGMGVVTFLGTNNDTQCFSY